LENKKGGMGSSYQEVPKINEKAHHTNHSTIMLLRSVGKIHSFKISPRFVFWTVMFFLSFIVASIIVINNYFDLLHENRALMERIKHFDKEVPKKERKLVKSERRIALLENYIQNLEIQQIRERQSREKETGQITVPEANEDKILLKRGWEKDKEEEEKSAKIVDVQDMVIQREGSRMTVNFKLVNMRQGEDALGGYIHIIALAEETDPSEAWAYPKEKLRNGMPSNFRRGMLFLIQRFKPIQGQIHYTTSSKPPKVVKVLIYDQSGRLILKKKFEVGNAS